MCLTHTYKQKTFKFAFWGLGPVHAPSAGGIGSIPGSKKIPWRRKWESAPGVLPGKLHEQKSLVDYSLWDRKELDPTETNTFTFTLQSKLHNRIALSHKLSGKSLLFFFPFLYGTFKKGYFFQKR